MSTLYFITPLFLINKKILKCCEWVMIMVKNKQEKRKHKESTKNRAQQWKTQNTKYMKYLRIPPSENKYLIINIINNTLMT